MYFDTILYINLKRRPDRNENVIAQLKKFGLEDRAKRIEGVDGKELDLDSLIGTSLTKRAIKEINNFFLNAPYSSLTRGGVGCALSHKLCFDEIIKQNKPALILEDDITFDDDFVDKLKDYEQSFPDDADIIFLGYHPVSKRYKFKKVNDIFGIPEATFGLFGYIVTPSGASKLVDLFPITKQIDTEMSKNFKNMNVYAVSPDKKIIKSDLSQEADTFGSDIQTNIFTPKNIAIGVILIVAIVLLVIFLSSNNQ